MESILNDAGVVIAIIILVTFTYIGEQCRIKGIRKLGKKSRRTRSQ